MDKCHDCICIEVHDVLDIFPICIPKEKILLVREVMDDTEIQFTCGGRAYTREKAEDIEKRLEK